MTIEGSQGSLNSLVDKFKMGQRPNNARDQE